MQTKPFKAGSAKSSYLFISIGSSVSALITMTLLRLEIPNHFPSACLRLAGTRSLRMSDLMGWKMPLSSALHSLPASTVTNTSAGLNSPSFAMRSIKASLFPSMRLTLIPVSFVKFSYRAMSVS